MCNRPNPTAWQQVRHVASRCDTWGDGVTPEARRLRGASGVRSPEVRTGVSAAERAGTRTGRLTSRDSPLLPSPVLAGSLPDSAGGRDTVLEPLRAGNETLRAT